MQSLLEFRRFLGLSSVFPSYFRVRLHSFPYDYGLDRCMFRCTVFPVFDVVNMEAQHVQAQGTAQ